MKSNIEKVGMVLLGILAFCIIPIIYYCIGFLSGAIIYFAFGTGIESVINVLFPSLLFSKSMIPIILGCLSVIGSFFNERSFPNQK